MTDPLPTAPAHDLATESPHERLKRAQGEEPAELGRGGVVRALVDRGSLRNDELMKAIGFTGDPSDWKRLLWRLQNEGYVKVRWVGLADPDPVEARITDRGRAWVAALGGGGGRAAGRAAGRETPAAR